jgi:hypothetical protein
VYQKYLTIVLGLYRLVRFARNEERADALLQIQALDILLEEAKTIYKDDSTNLEEDWVVDSAFSPALTIPTDHNDGDNDVGSPKSNQEACTEELSHIAKDLEKHIFSLMELVPSMENTLAQIKGKISAPARADFTVSEPAWPYVSLVRDKFGKADPKLIQRLGQANWERHTNITER